MAHGKLSLQHIQSEIDEKQLRFLVRGALQAVHRGKVRWKKSIEPFALALEGTPFEDADDFEGFRVNFSRQIPQGAAEKVVPLLLWLYQSKLSVLRPELLPKELKGASNAKDLAERIVSLIYDLEVADLAGQSSAEMPEQPSAGQRWGLVCTENDTLDASLVSFALTDMGQNPSGIGSLGVMLEFFAEPQEIDDGVVVGFRRATISTDIETDTGVKLELNNSLVTAKPVNDKVHVQSKAHRLNRFWELTANGCDMLNLDCVIDEPLFSIAPDTPETTFEAAVTVRRKDVAVDYIRGGKPDRNKEAVLALAFADSYEVKVKGRPVISLARQKYAVKPSE